MVNKPTRSTQNSASLIDLLFTSVPELFIMTGCKEVGVSDHEMIYGELKCKVDPKKAKVKLVRCLAKCDCQKLMESMKMVPWSILDTMDDVDGYWDCWKKMFNEVIEEHLPLRKVRAREHSLPWINQGLRKMMRMRNYYGTKAKKSKKPEDWEKYKTVRNEVTSMIRQARVQYYKKIGEAAGRNPRNMWRELNKLIGNGKRLGIDRLRTEGGVVIDRQGIADVFNEQFSSWVGVSGDGENGGLGFQASLPQLDCDFKFKRIEEEEVLQLLHSLDVKKSTGVDGIGAGLLHLVAPAVSGSLTKLFNFSLLSGEVPWEWKMARVSPIYKGGDIEIAGNYRPVSVLPVVSKIMEKLVHQQLYSYLQQHAILNPAQFGFRPNHSTQDVLVSMVDDWRLALDKDKIVGAVMIDLSKAFDSVNHSILCAKLEGYGVRAEALKWFRGYLSGRRQGVCFENAVSEWRDIKRGVPQGSILGPLLFTIYVNDLPEAVVNSRTKQYADDTTIYLTSDNRIDLERGLSNDLALVDEWLRRNSLQLNVRKTQMIVLSRRRRAAETKEIKVTLRNEAIVRSTKVKYLGVWIDNELKWSEHIAVVRRRCLLGLSKLRRLRDVLPVNIKKSVYNALIMPHLDYCSVLWQECSVKLQQKLQQVQNYGMRLILSQPPRTPSKELLHKLSWVPLVRRREMCRAVMIYRCLHNQVPAYFTNYFRTNADMGNNRTRGSDKIFLPCIRTEFGRCSFLFQGSLQWNKLKESLTKAKSLNSFRKLYSMNFY